MATATANRTVDGNVSGQALRNRLLDNLRYGLSRLFYAVLGAAGVLLWLLMQLPLGTRAKSTLVAAMAGCFAVFALGWRLLAGQSTRRRH